MPFGSARGFENANIQQIGENCVSWFWLHISILVVHHYSQFFKAGNYLGAISAYSHAISIGSKMPALYSNRAAAHLALGNLHKTIEDCSTVSTNKCCSLSTALICAIDAVCIGNSVLWQYISPIFKGQESRYLEFLTLEGGTDRLSQNIGKELPLHDA